MPVTSSSDPFACFSILVALISPKLLINPDTSTLSPIERPDRFAGTIELSNTVSTNA